MPKKTIQTPEPSPEPVATPQAEISPVFRVKKTLHMKHDDQDWCLIKWNGSWPERETYKDMIRSIFQELDDERVILSEETKQVYIRKDILEVFAEIVEPYLEYMEPWQRNEEMANKLDKAFGYIREPKKVEEDSTRVPNPLLET